MKTGPLVLEADVLEWSNTQTTAVLPTLKLDEPTQAAVVVLTAAGEIAESLNVAQLPSTSEPVVEQVESELPVSRSAWKPPTGEPLPAGCNLLLPV